MNGRDFTGYSVYSFHTQALVYFFARPSYHLVEEEYTSIQGIHTQHACFKTFTLKLFLFFARIPARHYP